MITVSGTITLVTWLISDVVIKMETNAGNQAQLLKDSSETVSN